MRQAFKEWAVICNALAAGEQSLILRKGGIAEPGGDFKLEQPRFWLYPTYVHQQFDGIREELNSWLEAVNKQQPPPGLVRISHFAEVTGVYHIKALPAALLLGHLHFWSDTTVQRRFEYKSPGLYALLVRVYQAAEVVELPETDAYRGCKSWVELDRDLPVEGATPVLTEQAMANQRRQVEVILNPRAVV